MNQTERMKELVELLNKAGKAYYQEDREIMSNYEYDKLYDELEALEKETGITLAGSPTVSVGYEAVNALPKETHETPMLSLDKTKEIEVLKNFVGNQKTVLSWKMDGLTIVLTYQDGKLKKAVTRGNGVVGEVITNNAKVFKNVPLQIAYQGELILRGEAIISYSDFEKINEQIEDVDAKYKNPRNLCSGSVRQLNNEITAKRNVYFYAFSLVRAEGVDFNNSRACQFEWLKTQGFDIVEYRMVDSKNLEETIQYFSDKISTNDFPSDGLVALYDDIAYGDSLGSTAKFPRNAFAFKWKDEIRETTLKEIEWSPSRTGLINPVAIFEPVELEGTTVSRASVHNISILKELELGIGDRIEVYKANMIIPQIAENLTRSRNLTIPEFCPVCKEKTKIQKSNDVEVLICTNPECQAKKIKSFTLFVSRDAMNIDGLSEATLEKFILNGFIKEFGDIYELEHYKDAIIEMDGFGEKSYENLMDNIKKSSHTTLPRLVYALGIANIGVANAKVLCKEFDYDLQKLMQADEETISQIEGVGSVIAKSVTDYFKNEENQRKLKHLLTYLTFEEMKIETGNPLSGKQFVITGSVNQFENRSAMKEFIEKRGGKVTGSVSKKTDYLINNDTESSSSKNKKAKELGIPILSEEDFLKLAESVQ